MRNWFTRIFLLATLFMATSCFGSSYETRYAYGPPTTPEGRMCVNQCQQMSTMCKQNCKLNKQQCETNSLLQAQLEYQNYLNAQQAKGLLINKTVDNFKRPCYNNSCEQECDQNFRFCFMNCGGQVREHTVCTAFC